MTLGNDDDRGDEINGEISEREFPDESDMDADDEAGTIDCPHCGKEIAEEAEWCPKCGQAILRDTSLPRPLWVSIAIVIVAIIMLLVWSRI